MTMAPAMQSTSEAAAFFALPVFTREVARGTQATWRHGHFGLKPASRGCAAGTPVECDFRPGKDGLTK
jgi:hypothetical protein